MMPVDVAVVFFLATVALAISPGPDNLFVLTQSAVHGPAAGIFVTLGLCTGLIVHTAAVALGIAALFATSELAFTVLKFCGAAYLLYLAWGAFRSGDSDLDASARASGHRGRLYARGVIMNITNPKVAIFFLAFLPQFADPERGSLTLQLLLLGAMFMAATLLVFGSVAVFAGFLGDWLRQSAKAQRALNRLAGVVFVGLALRLATTSR